MMTTYLVLMLLFAAPVAAKLFGDIFFQGGGNEQIYSWIQHSTLTSPLAAAFSLPLSLRDPGHTGAVSTWWTYTTPAFFAFYGLLNAGLMGTMLWMFNMRWRVSNS